MLDLINDKFQHLSFNRTKMKFLQGVKKRLESKLVRICQYDFPDTKCFGGNVQDDTATINAGMEIYCRNVLLLSFPFRSKNDLIIEGSYTKKLCSVIHNHELEKPKFEYFLNNVQNCKANCLRVPAQKDELEENTQMYSSEWNMIQDEEEEEDQQNTTGELTGDTLTEFLQLLNQEDISDAILDPKVIDLSFLQKKGRHACGYENLAQLSIETGGSEYIISNTEISRSIAEALCTNENNNHGSTESVLEAVRKSDIVSILLTKTNRREKNIMQIVKQAAAIQLCDANGSARSIIEWGCKCNLDNHQRRAFKVITASFVLTYFKDAGKNNEQMTSHDNQSRTKFARERKLLCQLAELRNDTVQLICCLYGPAGSGKSTVIELVLLYAKEYCSYLPNVIFGCNTIVVTAMTGVAATLICGETTHGALFLNQKCEIETEQIELWADTCLLIIDEISFASKSDSK